MTIDENIATKRDVVRICYTISSTSYRNVTLVLKCMDTKISFLEFRYRYSNSQCVKIFDYDYDTFP